MKFEKSNRLSGARAWLLAVLLALFSPGVPAGLDKEADSSEMVLIPAGKFIMGSNKVPGEDEHYGNAKPWFLDEHPEHQMELPDYYIDKYEVTNRDYLEFVKAVNVQPPEHWISDGYLLSLRLDKLQQASTEKLRQVAANVFRLDMDTRKMDKAALIEAIKDRLAYYDQLPVTFVNWQDAESYCEWKGKHLPTEAEWEKAMRGANGQEFAWGNEWKPGMAHNGESELYEGPAPVGAFETDTSPYGVHDMTGNVAEWIYDWYQPYPGSDYDSEDFGKRYKVVRGVGWSGGTAHYTLRYFQRAAYRFDLPPDMNFGDVGFRCARSKLPLTAHHKSE